MEILQIISITLGIIMTTLSLLTMCSEKFRDTVLKSKKRREEQLETDKCLLRNAILTNYKAHKDKKEWCSDDYENFEHLYKQYKKLGGNSFVDKLWKEVQTWKIIL